MTRKQVEVRGFDELARRFALYPVKFTAVVVETIATAMLVWQEHVPSYPPEPQSSTYDRTGTLGRSIGSGMQGGRVGTASVFNVRRVGSINYEGRFGTNLNYAPRVIGENQSYPFSAYWWKLSTVVGRSYGKVLGLFQKASSRLAEFLEGKGL